MKSTKTSDRSRSLRDMAAYVAAAYVSNNHVSHNDIGNLIIDIHSALHELLFPSEKLEPKIARASPQAMRGSIQKDHLISFIDGQSYKTLKRHLTAHGLDPHTYRKRYGLPSDYPMVAPSYAARRSEIAKEIQFGGTRAA